MNNPDVTVYITNFNYGKYLKKSIKSVLNQTFKNIEILIVDDGSTDNSRKILAEFRNKKNIRFIFQRNIGLNKSINIATKAAKGRFVLRLDADDYLDENAILLLYNKISKSEDIGLVYSDYYFINKNNEITKYVKDVDFFENLKSFYQPPHGACSLIRKSFLEEVNFYDKRFKRQDGVDIWFKFINKFKVKKINLPLFYYRQHSTSLSSNKTKIFQTRNKILRKFVKTDIKKINKVLIIPARSTVDIKNNLALAKIGNKNLISLTLEGAIKAKIFDKIIVTTRDKNIAKFLVKNYRKKIKIHKRPGIIQFENTEYNQSVISAIEKYCIKKPDVIVISHINYPFKKPFYYEKIINALIAHKADRILTLSESFENNLYKLKKNNFVQINDNDKGLLKLEKKSIFIETGGLTCFVYKKYKNFIKNRNKSKIKSNYMLIDKKSAFGINSEIDLLIANKVIKNTLY